MNAREPRCTGDRTAQPTAAQAFGGRRTRASPNGWLDRHTSDDARSVRRPAVLRVVRPGRSGIWPFSSWRPRRAYLADEFGSGGCVKRAARNEGCEREHVGYQHAPRADVQQLADTKARAVQHVACLLNGDGSAGISDDGAELALQGCGLAAVMPGISLPMFSDYRRVAPRRSPSCRSHDAAPRSRGKIFWLRAEGAVGASRERVGFPTL